MKYRDYKQFAQGNYYHIYNRGNNKQIIFKDDADYTLFLLRLKENIFPSSKMPFAGAFSKNLNRKILPEGAFSLVCYCLMPNHFHILIKQCTELPINKLLSKTCTSYAKCFNLKYESVGQVFQDQFKAIAVDNNEYLVWLSAYIHANPLVGGLVQNLEDWPWSSYGEFIAEARDAICDMHVVMEQFQYPGDYTQFVLKSADLIRERKKTEHLLLD